MAPRKKASGGKTKEPKEPKGAGRDVVGNDFSADEAKEYFDNLDEINERMKADAAAGRADMNAVYDKMCEDLGVSKESATFLWARHSTEKRFENRAKKMHSSDKKSLERFASSMPDTPMGDWAKAAADLVEESSSTKRTEQ